MTNEEAIKVFEDMKKGIFPWFAGEYCDMAIEALKQELRWIPVSERLPNFNDIVLASTDSDYEELKVILTVYKAEEFWFNGKIKAWMPLPEPYKPTREASK